MVILKSHIFNGQCLVGKKNNVFPAVLSTSVLTHILCGEITDMFLLQIWDFNLGRCKGHNELDHFGYCKNDEGFMVIRFGEVMIGTSSVKVLGDIYQLNCYVAPKKVAFFNVIRYCP